MRWQSHRITVAIAECEPNELAKRIAVDVALASRANRIAVAIAEREPNELAKRIAVDVALASRANRVTVEFAKFEPVRVAVAARAERESIGESVG